MAERIGPRRFGVSARWIAGAALALLAQAAVAHPGTGILVAKDGAVYFVDSVRNRVMKFKGGKLSVLFADPTGKRLSIPHHLYFDKQGNLITASDSPMPILRLSPAGAVSNYFPKPGRKGPDIGLGGDPFALAPNGSLYFVKGEQFFSSRIFRVTPEGVESFIAGGREGDADGRGAKAQFGDLHFSGMAFGPGGSLYLTDEGTSVRKIDASGKVTTIAGSSEPGYQNGSAGEARFKLAVGIAVAKDGTVYVAEYGNRRVRKIAPDGNVSTVAGSGEFGSKDGRALEASFQNLSGVALGPDGTLYTYEWDDRDCPRIRKITKDGRVATLVTVKPE